MRTLLAFLVALGWPFVGYAQTSTPKWSVHEIRLTASGASTNWYVDRNALVTAAFTGPAGVVAKVAGFWDGGDRFIIRFTPNAEGQWTYRTSSSNAGLDGKSGRFTCTGPRAGSHGFLRVDARHPYSFVWDDGTRYFMWGQTYYDVLQPALVNDNWKTSISKSLEYGMNKLRMHVYAQNYYKPGVEFTKYPDAQPYLGESRNPERDRLNVPYFRKLDEMVEFMGAKGVVTELIITNPYWSNRQFGTTEQNDRLVSYIVARYAAYPNVIWCIANEWKKGSQGRSPYRQSKSDFDRMGMLVHAADPWIAAGEFRRPLSIHNEQKMFEFFGSSWPSHVVNQYGGWNPDFDNGDQWGNAGIVDNLGHNMPVVNDEYGYIGQVSPKPPIRVNMNRTRLRGAIWGIAAAGGYGSAGDFRVTPDGMGNVEITGDWFDAPEEYGDLKRMIEFFTTKGIEYWKMSSQNAAVASGKRAYVLAETGRQYVVYAAVGGDVSINLPAGSYHAWRYDPVQGLETNLGSISGGGVRSFSLPADHDYVIRVKSVH